MASSGKVALMECPICLETMKKPILQCQRGHSMCGDCVKSSGIIMCPSCRSPLSDTRNYQLEQLIEGVKDLLKASCMFSAKGCKYTLPSGEKEAHEQECKFRNFKCEGSSFAKWACNWSGNYDDIYDHFKKSHKNQTWMQYKTEATLKISFSHDFQDVQIISFFNGQHYFYYKHKVDVGKEKAYWAFQRIGLNSQAKHFYYEFEVHNGPIRKFKMTEICTGDTVDINTVFDEEKCVVMSFTSIKNYLDQNGELPFKFRLMSSKKPL